MAEYTRPEGADALRRIDSYLRENGLANRGARVVPLLGDASDRLYFRVAPPDGQTLVLALHAGPIEIATLPFAAVAALLQRIPLPVPRILGHSDPLGIVALQDLGDVTLQAHLGATTATEHAALYQQAVRFIERLQRRGAELASDAHPSYRLAFDVGKLTWELDFFVRHLVEHYRGAALSAAERRALAEEWRSIAGELAAEPRVLCHRDYHSRNLMLHGGALFVIDFQDARMGPDTYDLVSLLHDSYVDMGDRDRDELVSYFLALKRPDGGPASRDAGGSLEFRRRFDLMAVQRTLKALGTFGYQATTRRNPAYIQYIPRTLAYARSTMEKHPRFARLRELLAAHLEELR
jgi:N-acetylmuramate 1-kinase